MQDGRRGAEGGGDKDPRGEGKRFEERLKGIEGPRGEGTRVRGRRGQGSKGKGQRSKGGGGGKEVRVKSPNKGGK